MKPNLFNFATSELSQDAFLCWLISWAKPDCKNEDEKLHAVANKFIDMLAGDTKVGDIKELYVTKQEKRVDVLVKIENVAGAKFIILIEDKVAAGQHGDQLERYKESIKNEYPEQELILIYLKTGAKVDYKNAEDKGYCVIDRVALLGILEHGFNSGITDSIYSDFYKHIKDLDNAINSYKHLPLKEWGWHSWEGFYLALQEKFEDSGWKYVANPSGGFLGFWWGWTGAVKSVGSIRYNAYLQLEYDYNNPCKFCFKVSEYGEKVNCQPVGDYYGRELSKLAAEKGIKLVLPSRRGSGETVTVLLFAEEFPRFSNEKVDVDKTVKLMEEMKELIREVPNG